MTNSVILGQKLDRELNDIKDKIEGDQKWYYIKSDQTLSLFDRPLTCFSKIWEWFSRLFHSKKYNLLNLKFIQIISDIDTFLEKSTGEERETFVKTYRFALNELFHIAVKIAQKHGLVGPDLKKYSHFSTLLELGPKLETIPSRFLLTNSTLRPVCIVLQLPGNETLINVEIPSGKTFDRRFDTFRLSGLKLIADLTISGKEREFNIENENDYSLIIGESGFIERSSKRKNSDESCKITIHNQSSWDVSFQIEGFSNYHSLVKKTVDITARSFQDVELRKKLSGLERKSSDDFTARLNSVLEAEELQKVKYHAHFKKRVEIPVKSTVQFFECTLEKSLNIVSKIRGARLVPIKFFEKMQSHEIIEMTYRGKKVSLRKKGSENSGIVLKNDSNSPIEVNLRFIGELPEPLKVLMEKQELSKDQIWVKPGEKNEVYFQKDSQLSPLTSSQVIEVSGTVIEWQKL